MLAGFGVLFYAIHVAQVWAHPRNPSDFIGFRSWAALLRAAPRATAIYDFAQVDRFIQAAIPGYPHHYPFAYPPSLLLLIWPLGYLSWRIGALAWMAAGIASYTLLLAEAPWRRQIAIGVLLVPVTALSVAVGQDGLIVAGLLAGGCRFLPRRPVLAGVLFGLAACKPQFGVLVPVALIAARQWRAIAAAVATVLATVAASGLAFGWQLWIRWPQALIALSRFAGENHRLYPMMPTVSGNLRVIGAAPELIWAAQALAALATAIVVWRVWRRRGPGRAASAVLLVGAFLATPYGFFYDLPILNAGLLAFGLERIARGARLAWWEWAIVALVVALPIAMDAAGLGFALPRWLPLSLPVLVAAFAMVAWRALDTGGAGGQGARPSPTP